MIYQIEANVAFFLFLPFVMHFNHFNLMFSCSSFNSLLMHMGNSKCNLNCLLDPFKLLLMPSSLFWCINLNCHASSHVWALYHVNWLCFLSLCELLFSLDDDVETDEAYEYPSEELAQHQDVECAGKYSLTWTIVPVSSLVTDSFRCLSC